LKTLGKLFLLFLIVAVGVVAYFWISIERPYTAFPP